MIPNLVFTHKNKVNTGWFLASPLQKWLSFQKHIKGYIMWPRLSKCYLKTKHNQSSVFFNLINTIFSQRFAVCKQIPICCWIFFTCCKVLSLVTIHCGDRVSFFQSDMASCLLRSPRHYFSLHSSHRLGSVILVVLLQQVICQFKHILYAIN